jgi:phosphoribosylglycinamide formyltransferase-1
MRLGMTGGIVSSNRSEMCEEVLLSQKKCKVGVLASGTGSNFRAMCEACRRDDYPAKMVCLVTDNPDAGAMRVAADYGIPGFVVPVSVGKGRLPLETEEEMARICVEHGVELIALAGFMRILKGPLLDRFDKRIMNIHPALLPSFPGLHSARQAVEYGVKVSGCTVHFVDRTIDGGAIIVQAVVPVEDDDDEDSLINRIHVEEHKSYVRAIELFAEGRLRLEGRRVKIL